MIPHIRQPISELALALFAFAGSADAQQFEYDGCGQFVQGASCLFFVDTGGERWFLDPSVTFGIPTGVSYRVTGIADPIGGGLCNEPHMSIYNATIASCSWNFSDVCSGDGGDQAGCTDCPCGNEAPVGTTGGCMNSAGSSSRLIAEGDPSVSLPPGLHTDLRFSMDNGPANALCVLTSGSATAPTNPMNPCFGGASGVQSAYFDGLRCAAQGLRRHGSRTTDLFGNVGEVTNPWGGEAAPTAGIAQQGVAMAAGQTRTFQVVHRDDPTLGCQRGLNTTQGVVVTFGP